MSSSMTPKSLVERRKDKKRRLGRLISLIGGYASTIVLTAVMGVAIIPVIIRVSGHAGWAAIAVGQSLGSIAAVVIALGWTITGPALIARASPAGRGQIVANSVVTRLWLGSLVLPVLCVVAHFMSPENKLASALAACNVASVGLGISWYFVGASSPKRLFLLDTVPRALGTLIGGIVLWVAGSLVALTLIQVVSGVVAAALSIRFANKSSTTRVRWYWSLRWAVHQIRGQFFPSATVLASAVCGAVPTIAVAWWSPNGIGVFALAERIGRYVTMSVTPMHSWMQGWVPGADMRSAMRRRILSVVFVSSVAGCAAGGGLMLAGKTLADVLSGGSVSVGYDLMAGIAIAIGMSTVSRCTGPACLVAIGAAKAVAFSTFCGAAACIIVLIAVVPTFGAVGAAYAMAASETTVVIYQVIVLGSKLRSDFPRGRRSIAGVRENRNASSRT